MNPLQKVYNWLKKLAVPKWLKIIIQEINDLMIAVMLQVGKDAIGTMKKKIVEVANMNIPNEEKFNVVFKFGKQSFRDIKDSTLNLLIETLVSYLKKNFAI